MLTYSTIIIIFCCYLTTVMSSSSSVVPSSRKATSNSSASSTDTNLAPLLRHFVGIDIIVETKQGRSFRGQLREADAYMNLVLSQNTANKGRNSQSEFLDNPGAGLTSEQFNLVHIRGPTIRYIVFGANVDVNGVIKAGRDRERAASDKYRRGIRKARK